MESGPPVAPRRSRCLAGLWPPAAMECVAVAVLMMSAAYALHVSWRRWPDPIIDAGHQLYMAWQLSEGATLYEDVGCLYGPLSSHLNALLFRVFGPGMMVLVWANLLVYAAILALAYRLFRVAHGVWGGFVACAVFVWVFSFNQLVTVGNYTYALPYAHESTHGFLVSLALVAVAGKWTMQGRRRSLLGMGLLCGLTLVLKPEFMLVGLAVVATAVILRRLQRQPLRASELALFLAAAAAPMAMFTIWFWRRLTFVAAFRAANQAWWTVLVTRVHAHVWGTFLGTDNAARNLVTMLVATIVLALGAGTMWLGAHRMSRGSLLAGLLVPLPAALALAFVDWTEVAWCVPLALLLLILDRAVKVARGSRVQSPAEPAQVVALLLAVTAAVLLVRMVLHPRVYHFGFYQAALATMVVAAELVVLLHRTAGQQRTCRVVVLASSSLVILAACSGIFLRSQDFYSSRSFPVGTGRDQFLAFAPADEASGALVGRVVDELRRDPAQDRVLVVPEGLMINYLVRRKSPLVEWIFIDLTLAGAAEDTLVEKLAAHPPEHVVLISRDLREHGITRFGAPGQPGGKMLDFFRRNYRPRLQLGGDPLDPKARGALMLDLSPPR